MFFIFCLPRGPRVFRTLRKRKPGNGNYHSGITTGTRGSLAYDTKASLKGVGHCPAVPYSTHLSLSAVLLLLVPTARKALPWQRVMGINVSDCFRLMPKRPSAGMAGDYYPYVCDVPRAECNFHRCSGMCLFSELNRVQARVAPVCIMCCSRNYIHLILLCSFKTNRTCPYETLSLPGHCGGTKKWAFSTLPAIQP